MNDPNRKDWRDREARERRRPPGARPEADPWQAQQEEEARAGSDTEWREYVNPNFREAWRTHFRGGYGNPGMAGEAAWGRSGLGAGYYEPPHGWARASRRGFGPPDYEAQYRGQPGPPFRGRAGYRGSRRFPGAYESEQGRTPDEEYYGLEETFGEEGVRERDRIIGTDWPTIGTTDWGRERGVDHSGMGPEGYHRSDDRIFEDVCDRLTDHSAIDARGIRVRSENGEVTLEGTVANRQAKRLAETIAESARGVRDVHNRLRVSERAADVP